MSGEAEKSDSSELTENVSGQAPIAQPESGEIDPGDLPPVPSEGSEEAPRELEVNDKESSVSSLQQKFEEVQLESSLLKEWGVRVEMYVDCLVDALEANQITHVYDIDGSLVSLDECRQKAKTLPHTRKPHCDEDLRTKQYETEIDTLRQEVEELKTDLEEAMQRYVEQEYLAEQLQTAEYQANCRWETYHEDVVQQWTKNYSDLQDQYSDVVGQFEQLSSVYNNLKRSVDDGETAAGGKPGANWQQDKFRRSRSAGPGPVRRGDMEEPRPVTPEQYHQRRPNTRGDPHFAPAPAPVPGDSFYHQQQGRASYRGYGTRPPVLLRAERAAILKQFFANLNMIQRRQDEMQGARRGRRYEQQHQRPGPSGEAHF